MTNRALMLRLSLAACVSLLCSVSSAQTDSESCDCMPETGQPAADILASSDLWGNPTFIGGITNRGPESGSVW